MIHCHNITSGSVWIQCATLGSVLQSIKLSCVDTVSHSVTLVSLGI